MSDDAVQYIPIETCGIEVCKDGCVNCALPGGKNDNKCE